MTFPLTLLDLAGTVALLLWGARMVQTGVQRAFGARLRALLATMLRGPVSAFLAGLGVTAVLQSSTATGLMLAGFAADGLVDLVPALAVMLGANVGTTLIVQLLAVDISAFAPALILLGVVAFRRSRASRPRDLGRAAIGLGLMLLALRQLLDLVTPYEDAPSLVVLLGAVAREPLIDVLIAAGLTWAAHSSVAIVLLVVSLAAKGAVPPHAAFALVLGANLGTALNPLLEGAARDDPAARRVPAGNLGTRVVGVAVGLLVLPWVGPRLMILEPDPARAVADVHTGFNLALALLFFPLLPAYARLLHRLFPDQAPEADPARPRFLDEAARANPSVALAAAQREALRLAEVLETMLLAAGDVLLGDDRRQIAAVKRIDDVLDRLNAAIKTYISGLDPAGLAAVDNRRIATLLAFVTGLEHAGDVIERNLLGHAAKRQRRALALPPAMATELKDVIARLIANVRAAAAVFLSDDIRAARLLAAEKERFRALEADAAEAHFAAVREGPRALTDASAWRVDLLRDLKRINDHLVAAAAYPVLERQGELLPTRLRGEP